MVEKGWQGLGRGVSKNPEGCVPSVALETGAAQPRDTEEGPPRTEGVVPPRSERGKARSDSGGIHASQRFLRL
ncbi:hypothetical protein CHL79_13660 [Delftia acidovorans]|nr:hypothetical protein CHL79_13660 [Delftia acidovorans]